MTHRLFATMMQGLFIQASITFEILGGTHSFGFAIDIGVSSNFTQPTYDLGQWIAVPYHPSETNGALPHISQSCRLIS